ncbi:hypothetical protein M758_5G091200 [Ceratodon purpureus]|nr:hypothetical protein M758_5G091200 [Ceratodon purpureus]
MRGALSIAAKTKKLDVDNRFSLKYYYRTADNLLKQAQIYRDEGNLIDYYILLLRFSSLVSETIPEHRDYRTYLAENKDYRRKLLDVITELEKLKPEIQKQVDQYNKKFVKSTGLSYSLPSSYSTPYNTSSSYNNTLQPNTGLARPSYNRNQFEGQGPGAYASDYGRSGPGYNPPSSSYFNTSLDDQLKNLTLLNIPRAKEETLSRHSILGSVPQQPRRESASARVQYPNNVAASPIELPSLFQDWNVSAHAPASGAASTDLAVSSNVTALDFLSNPASQSSLAIDVAPPVKLIRQPSPPPIAAPVQTVQAGLDAHHHSETQLSPALVADPRPGAAQTLDGDLSKGPKHLHISTKMMDEFLRLAKANTTRNLETCGVLAGSLKKGIFYVSTLIIPKQEATSDSCQTVNEEEIFDSQDKRGLFQLGWIHTHPTQTCFMSSIDLHTHYSYQIMLPEAIAIVMAPTDSSRTFGIFRLAEPGGVKVIQECQRRGFHPHEDPPDGGPIYEHCNHVYMNPKLQFDVIDLRAQ